MVENLTCFTRPKKNCIGKKRESKVRSRVKFDFVLRRIHAEVGSRPFPSYSEKGLNFKG